MYYYLLVTFSTIYFTVILGISIVSGYDQYCHSKSWKQTVKSFFYGSFIGMISPAVLFLNILDNFIDKM